MKTGYDSLVSRKPELGVGPMPAGARVDANTLLLHHQRQIQEPTNKEQAEYGLAKS